jgi:hypothetical protein
MLPFITGKSMQPGDEGTEPVTSRLGVHVPEPGSQSLTVPLQFSSMPLHASGLGPTPPTHGPKTPSWQVSWPSLHAPTSLPHTCVAPSTQPLELLEEELLLAVELDALRDDVVLPPVPELTSRPDRAPHATALARIEKAARATALSSVLPSDCEQVKAIASL